MSGGMHFLINPGRTNGARHVDAHAIARWKYKRGWLSLESFEGMTVGEHDNRRVADENVFLPETTKSPGSTLACETADGVRGSVSRRQLRGTNKILTENAVRVLNHKDKTTIGGGINEKP